MRVYLDWNATTPPLPEALEAMRDALARGWANPSSIHGDGRAARAIVEDGRAAVASLTGVDPRDVVFTAGGTEANNLALAGATRIVTSRLEHPSITRVAEGGRAHWVRVTRAGQIDLDDLASALESTPEGTVVTVQAVNHETGIVQPVREVIERAHAAGARVHVDAIQGWGKIEIPSGWDTASVAAHKIRGPKGIGALVMRPGVRIEPVLRGGAQERGVRPGTVSASLAAGFGAAALVAATTAPRWRAIAPLRDRLERALVALGDVTIAGDPALRAPHVANLIWKRWASAELVAALDLEGVSVSSGAACSAGTVEPSPVLVAMLGEAEALSGLRVSLGDTTTEADIDAAIAAFQTVLSRRS